MASWHKSQRAPETQRQRCFPHPDGACLRPRRGKTARHLSDDAAALGGTGRLVRVVAKML